jgi:RNA polymerase sigma factor (sigma-70 family)
VWPRFATDDRLVALVRRGELTAFEIVYDRHARELLAFCGYILDSQHDAEDAVQSAFASAYKALMADDRPVELRPWLFAIARNASLSILRKRRPTSEIHEAPALGEDPALRAEQRESLRLLVATMLELPERQRTALVLAELHGLSHREIATVLDVPGEKVKSYIYQARASVISEHVARGADCAVIREELSTARGPALLKTRLRRHLRSCEGCRDYAAELSRRRGQLGIAFPLPAPLLALKRRVLGAAASGDASPAGIGVGGSAVGASLAGTGAELAGAGVKALVAKVLIGAAGAAGVAGIGIGTGAGTLALSAAATNRRHAVTRARSAHVRAASGATAGAQAGVTRDLGGVTPTTSALTGAAPAATGGAHQTAGVARHSQPTHSAAAGVASGHRKSAEAHGKSAEAHGKSAEAHGKSEATHGKSKEAQGSALHGRSGEAHGKGSAASGATAVHGKSETAHGGAAAHGESTQAHGNGTGSPPGSGPSQARGGAGSGSPATHGASGNSTGAGNGASAGAPAQAQQGAGAKGASPASPQAPVMTEPGAAQHGGGEANAPADGAHAAPGAHAQKP